LDRPIREVANDDNDQDMELEESEWADWEEDDDWSDFSLSKLLEETPMEEETVNQSTEDLSNAETVFDLGGEEQFEDEEESEDEDEDEGVFLPYFTDGALVENQEEPEEEADDPMEETLLNVLPDLDNDFDDDPLLCDDPITQESTMLVDVDNGNQFDPMSEEYDVYIPEEEPFWKSSSAIFIICLLTISFAFLTLFLMAS
jgi:hypothetical protein